MELQEMRIWNNPMNGGYTEFQNVQLEPLLATLRQDALLAGFPRKKPTLKELETLMGLQKGRAMMLTVRKMDGTSFVVAVMNKATVRDLKAAVQKKVEELEQKRLLGHRHISWKHVWGNFCLLYNHEKLLCESSLLNDFGIKHGDELCYAHHLAHSPSGRHSHMKKRRFFDGLRKSIHQLVS